MAKEEIFALTNKTQSLYQSNEVIISIFKRGMVKQDTVSHIICKAKKLQHLSIKVSSSDLVAGKNSTLFNRLLYFHDKENSSCSIRILVCFSRKTLTMVKLLHLYLLNY